MGAMTGIDEVDGLRAADVMHPRLGALPATATVGEVRAWFAVSESRRLAVLTDGERYVGAIPRDDAQLADDGGGAAAHARREPVIAPGAPAAAARELALARACRRVPVVDADGRLVGIVAIDKHLTRFCGT